MSTPRGGRVALIVIGALVATFAAAVIVIAGLLHWAAAESDGDGYYMTDPGRFSADARAISSSDIDIDEGVVALTGDDGLRVRVRSESGKPVFVGVGPFDRVAAYLADTPQAVLDDIDLSPFRPTFRFLPGERTPERPAEQDFWTSSAVGAGEQTLSWDPDRGSWAIVLMNADASMGIDASVRAGAKVPLIGTLAWVATGVGLFVLAVGVLLVVVGVRRRRPPPSWPAGSASAA